MGERGRFHGRLPVTASRASPTLGPSFFSAVVIIVVVLSTARGTPLHDASLSSRANCSMLHRDLNIFC